MTCSKGESVAVSRLEGNVFSERVHCPKSHSGIVPDNLDKSISKSIQNRNDNKMSAAVADGRPQFEMFTGELDEKVLAAEAAALNDLVESMEETLETNELIMHQEEEQWSTAAQISLEKKKSNGGMTNDMDAIAMKMSKKMTLLEDYDSQDMLSAAKEELQKQRPESFHVEKGGNKEKDNGSSSVEEQEEEGGEEEEDINDDLSIDGSMSSNSTESSSSASSSSSGSSRSLYDSAASMSIFEIQACENNNDGYKRQLEESDEVLLQNGILRVDESTDDQAYICDWGRWRQWKKRKLESSIATANSSHEASYFDWKSWSKKRKNGHHSSTSRTNSFSISDHHEDIDENFDADSVLAKLDEWEVMMEEQSSHNSSSDAVKDGPGHNSAMSFHDSSSMLPEEEPDHVPGDMKSPRKPHSRSDSSVLRRSSLQPKVPLYQSPIGPEWKQWQREKRRSGIWKRTVSQRDNNGFPSNLDDNTSDDDESASSSSNRTKLTKSQSEKWNANSASSTGATGSPGKKKQRNIRRTQSLRLPDVDADSDTPSFDWNAYRKDNKRSSALQRSKSDRWSKSDAPSSERAKVPRKSPRRTKSYQY